MKIVSISMVKNESDIIESFIRYQLNIVDEMIILDDFSNDSTPNIIKSLINEGLPITLINNTNNPYAQDIKMTELLYKAVEEHDADIVCLLDSDEFIISDDGENPRKILKTIDTTKYHLIKWITFIPTPTDDYNIKFIPRRINHIRDENIETFYKVIVPKEIVKNYKVKVDMGNHDLTINKKKKSELSNHLSNLKLGHIPLRSKEQLMSKIMVGWPNTIAINTENKSMNFHWEYLFNKIKKDNDITLEDLELFSKKYAISENIEDIRIKKYPMNLDFCEDIDIKYNQPYNYLSNVLENSVSLANEIVTLKKELNVTKKDGGIIKPIKMKIYDKFLK